MQIKELELELEPTRDLCFEGESVGWRDYKLLIDIQSTKNR